MINPTKKPQTLGRGDSLFEAFEKSLDKAYELSSESFWIEGEVDKDNKNLNKKKNKM